LDQIKKNADVDDESQIYFNKFLMILDKYGVRLNSEEREQLLHSFPGKEGGDDANKYGKRINIARIYDQKYNIILEQMYKRVDVAEAEAADEPTDVNGYLG